MGPLDLADIEELKVKQGQQRDKVENAPKDKAIKATDKAHKAGNITDKEHIENLKNAPTLMESIINNIYKVKDFAVDSVEDAKEFQPWWDVGGNIGALGVRAIDATIPRTPQELQAELVELKAAGAAYPALKLAKEIPIVKKGLGKLDEATIAFRTNLYNNIHASIFKVDQVLPDGTIVKKGTQPLNIEGSGVGKTTPGRYLEKISKDKPISSGRQPGDYTVSELESAIRGPGKEAYKPYLRNQVEKIDLNLGKKLQKKYGGTDEDVKSFIRKQVNAEIEVREALSQLNSKQRDFQIGQLNVDNMTAKEIEEAVKKLSKTTFYELGHIRSAKNVFRYEDLMGANRASNMFPEIAENVIDYSRTTGNPIKTVQGNRGRQARTDIPDDILTMTGTSRTIDEEYLKFINPELENVLTDLIPPQHQDRLFKIVEEGWKRFSSAGYPDFAEFLDEVHGIKYYKYNKLPQAKKNSLRVEFNKQKEPVIGKQQLDQFKPFVRRIVDEYIGSIQAGKDLQKYTEKGLASVDMDQLMKMLQIK
tara:strand:+ start:237 stop:1838 length:1602 start_codon:yes stop_codon:yes gene_type:complete